MSGYEPKENEVLTKSVRLNEKDNGSTYFSVNIADVERILSLIDSQATERGVKLAFNTVTRTSAGGRSFLSTQMFIDGVQEPQQGDYKPGASTGAKRGTWKAKSNAAEELSRVGKPVA